MNPIRHLPTTVATITRTAAPTSRRRRRAAAAMIPLLVATGAGPAAADNPPVDVLGCAPITCVAQYIGVPTNTLSARLAERQRAGGGLGIDLVLGMLDTAEQTKLAAVTSPSLATNVFQVRQIMQDHNDLEDLIITYLISGVLPPQ